MRLLRASLGLAFSLFCFGYFLFMGGEHMHHIMDEDIVATLKKDGFEFGIVFFMLASLALIKAIHELVQTTDPAAQSTNYSGNNTTISFPTTEPQTSPSKLLPNNKLKTTRYTFWTLFPVVLIEYMIDVSNIYFEVVVILQVFTDWSPTGKHSTYPGLIVAFLGKVLLVLIEELKRGWDDWKANSKIYERLQLVSSPKEKLIVDIKNGDITPGTLVLINDGDEIPVDGPVVASSEGLYSPILLKEAALTGETAPAEKYPVDVGVATLGINPENYDGVWLRYSQFFAKTRGKLECSAPSTFPTNFRGKFLDHQGQAIASFDHSNSVFRGSILQGTEWILVYTVYTGGQTKLGQCFERTPNKRTPLDEDLNRSIRSWNFRLLFVLVIASVFSTFVFRKSGPQFDLFNIFRELVVNFLQLNGLNNLSMQLMGDFARIGQCNLIANDPSISVSANRTIPDVLGNIDVILSDKTGTLTKNKLRCRHLIMKDATVYDLKSMEFLRDLQMQSEPNSPLGVGDGELDSDSRLLKSFVTPTVATTTLRNFLEIMCLCNKVIPKAEKFFSSNPDDEEFVKRAQKYGCILVDRYRSSHSKQEDVVLYSHWEGEKKFQVLNVHEFESNRKYMSVIVKDSNGIKLLLKGANRVVFDRLSPENYETIVEKDIPNIIHRQASEGYRMLVWAQKILTTAEYSRWNVAYEKALATKQTLVIEECWNELEQKLEFVGSTAVDDKLQDGVEQVVSYAKECGIKVVMATGDAVSTAVAIWNKVNTITGKLYFLTMATETGKLTQEQLISQLRSLTDSLDNYCPDDVFIVDGEALNIVLEFEECRCLLVQLLKVFSSVVCARVSSTQKAEVCSMFMKDLNLITMAIGDGGNDVTMLQRAHVGIGLDSKETDAAGRAADFRSLKFKYVKQLLIHGLQNYFRLSSLYLWNDYKALMLALVPFFSRMFQMFDGRSLIPGDIIFVLTTIVFAYPVVLFGMLDVPISADELAYSPQLYKQNRHSRFNQMKKLVWWINAFVHAFVIIFATKIFMTKSSLLMKGVVAGQMMSLVGNVRLLLESRRGLRTISTWNLVLIGSCISSVVLFLPIARINLLFDADLRLQIGGTTSLPELNVEHVILVALIGFICLCCDIFIYYLFGETHLLSFNKHAKQKPQFPLSNTKLH